VHKRRCSLPPSHHSAGFSTPPLSHGQPRCYAARPSFLDRLFFQCALSTLASCAGAKKLSQSRPAIIARLSGVKAFPDLPASGQSTVFVFPFLSARSLVFARYPFKHPLAVTFLRPTSLAGILRESFLSHIHPTRWRSRALPPPPPLRRLLKHLLESTAPPSPVLAPEEQACPTFFLAGPAN